MDNTKENDWLSYLMANPNYTVDDFRDSGVNASNTTLGDAKTYESKQTVQNLPQFQTDGKFDKAKFESFYNVASSRYNDLADSDHHDNILNFTTFHRDNIYVPASRRRQGADTFIQEVPNPMQQYTGLYETDIKEDPTKTAMEIAESNPVWDEASKSWHNSPNDSFTTDFFDTRVMAQWDSDGDSIDPLTGEKVHHQKGQYKTNEFGYYYAENLNGRSPVGKQVISKFNTLTTDGSFWNKYDFFDSDDKDKSVIGSLVKNALPLALLSIPYVNTVYLVASLSKMALELGSTVGKCFAGSDVASLNYIDSFSKSLNMDTSEYSKTHPWSIENVLGMASDTAQMLWIQRDVFKKAPKLFGLEDMQSSARARAMQDSFLEDRQLSYKKSMIDSFGGPEAIAGDKTLGAAIDQSAKLKAAGDLDKVINDYNNVGKAFSQAYMALMPVAGVYDSLKEEGAGDVEASMLTLGIAAGNSALMSLPISSWVLPELKVETEGIKQAVSTIVKHDVPILQAEMNTAGAEASESAQKVIKNNYLKKLFEKGRDEAVRIYNANYSATATTLKSTLANSASAAAVGVGFEVMTDLAKSIANTVRWFNGNSNSLPVFNNLGERYGKAVVGGILGGGIMQFASDFRSAKALDPNAPENKDPNKLYDKSKQTFYALLRNGKRNEIDKVIDSTPLASTELSFDTDVDSNGKIYFKPGTPTNNQDVTVKTVLKRSLDMYENNLIATDANKTDKELISINTLNDIRYSSALSTHTATAFIKDFNDVVTREGALKQELYNLEHPSIQEKMAEGKTDMQSKAPDPYLEDQLAAVKNKLQTYSDLRMKFLNGDYAKDFMSNAVYELTIGKSRKGKPLGAVTEESFMLAKSGKDNILDIPDAQFRELKQQYETYKDIGESIDVTLANAELYKSTAANISQHLLAVKDAQSNPDLAGLQDKIFAANLDVAAGHKKALEPDETGLDMFTAVETSRKYVPSALIASMDILSHPLSIAYKEFTDSPNLTMDQTRDLIYKRVNEPDFEQTISKLQDAVIPTTVKNRLLRFLSEAGDKAMENDDMETYDKVGSYVKMIRSAKNGLLVDLLNKVSLATTKKINVSSVLDSLSKQAEVKSNSLGDFFISDEEAASINKVNDLIKTTIGYIDGATTMKLNPIRPFNLNETLNELYGQGTYAEIDSKTASDLKAGLSSIADEINYYIKLNDINNSANLKIQDRTAVRKNILVYDRFNEMSKIIPDSWEGKNDLINTLGGLTKLKDIATAFKSGATADFNVHELLPEVISMDNAWYDFMAANKGKDLSEIINSKNFNFYETSLDALSPDTKTIDDHSFIYYLAARSALKADTFYKEYRSSIQDTIAPIDTQELGIYLGYAYCLNKGEFKRYSQAVIKSIQEDATRPDFADKRKYLAEKGIISWKSVMDSPVTPIFDIAFVEGFPGSGKTRAVAKMIYTMLSANHPELLKNVWVTSTNKAAAEELKTTLSGSDNIKAMDKNEIMTSVSSEWSQIVDSFGNVSLSLKDFTPADNKDGVHSTYTLNDTEVSKIPSMILVDEATKYTELDMDLINRYGSKYGIPVIIFGDDDQNKLVGKTMLPDGSKFEVGIFRNNFITTPKFGVSLRFDNKQVHDNLELIRKVLIEQLRNTTKTNEEASVLDTSLSLSYYKDGTSLFGTRVFSDYDIFGDEGKKEIDFLFSHATPIDKIGLIVPSTDSELLKYIEGIESYKDKYTLFTGNNAQSSEATYYIIEDKKPDTISSDDNIQRYRALYTSMSRVRRGSILVTNDFDISERSDSSTKAISLKPEDVKSYSEKKQKAIDTALKDKDIQKSEYTPVNKENKQVNTAVKKAVTNTAVYVPTETPTGTEVKEKNEKPVLPVVIGTPLEKPEGTEVKKKNEKPTEQPKGTEVKEENEQPVLPVVIDTPVSSIAEKPTEQPVLPVVIDTPVSDLAETSAQENLLSKDTAIDNSKKESISESLGNETVTSLEDNIDELPKTENRNIFLYSTPTNTTGWILNDSGKWIPPKNTALRLDGFNGLSKIISNWKDWTEDEKVSFLFELKSDVLYGKNKSDIVGSLKTKLASVGVNINEAYGTFGYRITSTYELGKDMANQKFLKYINHERGYSVSKHESAKSDTETEHTVVFILGGKVNGVESDVLEFPVLTLMNPDTYTKGLLDSEFGYDWLEYKDTNNLKTITGPEGKAFISRYLEQHPGDPKISTLYNLVDMYSMKGYGMYLFDGELSDFTPSRDMQNLGIRVDRQDLGQDYQTTGYEYTEKEIPLEQFATDKKYSVSQIFQPAVKNLGQIKQEFLIKPFVLIGDAGVPRSELVETYRKQLLDESLPQRVKLYYVDAPYGTLSDYVDNLTNIFVKADNISSIGNMSTSFRILNILFGINSDTARFIEKAVSGYNSEKGTIADANLILEKIGLSDTVQKLGLSNRSLADMNNLMDGLKDLLRVYTIGNYDSSGHRLEKSDLNKIANTLNMEVNGQSRYYRNKFQRMLFEYTTSGDNESRVKNDAVIDFINSKLSSANFDRIYYYPKYARGGEKVFAPLEVDGYKLNGKDFTINGKVDTTSFIGDISKIANLVRRKRTPFGRDGIFKFADYTSYVVKQNSRIRSVSTASQQESPYESFISGKLESVKASPNVIESLKSELKNVEQDKLYALTMKDITSLLKSKGHLVLSVNNRTFVFGQNDLLKDANVGTPKYNPQSGKWDVSVKITKGLKTELTGEFDPNASTLKLESIPTEESTQVSASVNAKDFKNSVLSIVGQLDPKLPGAREINRMSTGNLSDYINHLRERGKDTSVKNIEDYISKLPESETKTSLLQQLEYANKEKAEKAGNNECLEITINL